MTRDYLPNTWPSLGKTYYVAQRHPQASDANPGTEASPFKTITAAAAVADMYDRVVIDEGVYREQIPILRHGHRYRPRSWIVFEAAPGKEVYLKGSDVFNPDWESIGLGVYKAKLPEHLFEEGAYNPYALSCAARSSPMNYEYDRGGYNPRRRGETSEGPGRVRPTQSGALPETLGQVYVEGQPLEQVTSVEAVRQTAGSFMVSGDGREIICHFADGKAPGDKLVELTVRERCFKRMFPAHWGGLMTQTVGIVAEHAADPEAFSLCRPLSIRRNRRSGITVRKTFHALNRVAGGPVLRSNLSYLSKDGPTIMCHVVDGTKPLPPHKAETIVIVSHDGAKTWERLESGPLAERVADYSLDEENGMLVRHYKRPLDERDVDWGYGAERHALMQEVSGDGGKTWSPPQRLDLGNGALGFTILRLRSGKLFWITTESKPEMSALWGIKPDPFFFITRTWRGRWREDLSGIDWEAAGGLQVGPEVSSQGLDEPHACQFPDGKLFAIFRQGCILPSQDQPGYPSVKLFAVSDDEGRTWTAPKPLTFDDGTYVYSPTSTADTICSSRNGRVYVILNILNRPNVGCLPRAVLHVGEIDQNTLCLKRDTVTVIDELLEDQSHFVGFSNWGRLEDRYTKNLNLFMRLENGPVYDGYDHNSYRYEIEFPA